MAKTPSLNVSSLEEETVDVADGLSEVDMYELKLYVRATAVALAK